MLPHDSRAMCGTVVHLNDDALRQMCSFDSRASLLELLPFTKDVNIFAFYFDVCKTDPFSTHFFSGKKKASNFYSPRCEWIHEMRREFKGVRHSKKYYRRMIYWGKVNIIQFWRSRNTVVRSSCESSHWDDFLFWFVRVNLGKFRLEFCSSSWLVVATSSDLF